LAFTIIATKYIGLEALAILFQTIAAFAMATFGVLALIGIASILHVAIHKLAISK
jgi:hypothetical protein